MSACPLSSDPRVSSALSRSRWSGKDPRGIRQVGRRGAGSGRCLQEDRAGSARPLIAFDRLNRAKRLLRFRGPSHEYSRISGQGAAARIRRTDLQGRAGVAGLRFGCRRQNAGRSGLGGEEPDSRRRPRQGQIQGSLGRRQGRRGSSPNRSPRSMEFAKQMLGATLVTVQTRPHGKQVNRLYIEDGSDIDKEFYLFDSGQPRNLRSVVRGLHRRRRQHRGRRA